MRALIIYTSVHHGNTKKIAKTISETLDADLMKASEIKEGMMTRYDIIGFGSGIYWGKHHKSVLELVDKGLKLKGKKAFVFSTSGLGNIGNLIHNIHNRNSHFHDPLKRKLEKTGMEIIGEFSCRGFDTAGFFKYIGGIKKGRPDQNDIEDAKGFARSLE